MEAGGATRSILSSANELCATISLWSVTQIRSRPRAAIGTKIAAVFSPLSHIDVPESMALKVEIFQRVAKHAPSGALFASNTSSLSVTEMAAMISPPARNFLNSTFVNVQSLRDIEGEPLLEIHPDDALSRGIADGGTACVFNDRGLYRCRARVSDRARPGVVNGLGIWWRKLGLDVTNVNELTHQRLTDIGRAPTFYDCLVEVRPA